MKQEEVIEMERMDLESLERKKKDLNSKWFKTSHTKSLVQFLEFYCKEKKEFIKRLEDHER